MLYKDIPQSLLSFCWKAVHLLNSSTCCKVVYTFLFGEIQISLTIIARRGVTWNVSEVDYHLSCQLFPRNVSLERAGHITWVLIRSLQSRCLIRGAYNMAFGSKSVAILSGHQWVSVLIQQASVVHAERIFRDWKFHLEVMVEPKGKKVSNFHD